MGGRILLVLVFGGTTGCVKRYEMRPEAYWNGALDYEVATADGPGVFVSPEWRLENYVEGETLRTGPGYETDIWVDHDDDGRSDTRFTMPVHDLRLVHRHNGAIVWLRTIILSRHDRDRALDGLVREYVDAASGLGVTGLQSVQGAAVAVTRSFATDSLDNFALRVDGREAFGATFDVANVDQIQLEHDRRAQRVRIVLVRTGRGYVPWGTRRRLEPFPALLMFGCASRPEDFGIAASALRALVFATNFVTQDDAPVEPAEIATEWPWDRPQAQPAPPPVLMTPTPAREPAPEPPFELPVENPAPEPTIM